MTDWKIFQGSQNSAEEKLEQLKSIPAPSWRRFMDAEQQDELTDEAQSKDDKYWQDLRQIAAKKTRDVRRGETFRLRVDLSEDDAARNPYEKVIEAVNAAIYLRRPLLVTGQPGSGKTSLAYAIARELNLGPVLLWAITARSVLREALYQYDAIARLQDAQLSEQLDKLEEEEAQRVAGSFKNIGQYIRLGHVGTAFLPSQYPRVLLIDEIDKSDINLPNDLLNLFEEGSFEIDELKRLSKLGNERQAVESDDGLMVDIPKGKVRCQEFPIIIMTSNGERDFPPAFYRRCLRVKMPSPSQAALKSIVEAHLGNEKVKEFNHVIKAFFKQQEQDDLADLPTDQLLNLIYLFAEPKAPSQNIEKSTLRKLLFNPLDDASQDEVNDVDA